MQISNLQLEKLFHCQSIHNRLSLRGEWAFNSFSSNKHVRTKNINHKAVESRHSTDTGRRVIFFLLDGVLNFPLNNYQNEYVINKLIYFFHSFAKC